MTTGSGGTTALGPPPEALLFDLDGVIADVSRSYRAAIRETAKTFSISIDAETIATAKAGGNANNDWELTYRLLAERGIDAPFEQVKQRFEQIYQGTAGQPGLWRTERMLVERELLAELAERLPLGIVTGRPRADATRFLQTHDIDALFRALVCLEDAPSKPDPAPVRLLLERLGAQQGWMVGDTPDDMRAASDAGVVALGILAPGDEAHGVRAALERAGATRVLSSLSDLQGMLSP